MMKAAEVRAKISGQVGGGFDGDGNPIKNTILRALPRTEFNQVFTSLEFVRLRLHQIHDEVGKRYGPYIF